MIGNIKFKTIMLITSGLLIQISCSSNSNKNFEVKQTNNIEMKTQLDSSLFPQGGKLSNEWFTGNAFLQPLLAKDKNNDFAMGSVTFEPGARTIWHTHPKGQVLIVTEGKGWYQEKGKPAQSIKKGDVVNIPENLEHWHGAAADSKMVHIAVTNYRGDENVTWLKPVTDSEYNQVNNK
ncbi:quercetin dioxygenase-like cupin family protein [Chryseobacterium sp. W4I1]|nr:quercetin dioxygenase-like cupin family protein [Chryseobacterium sp. W4I1]